MNNEVTVVEGAHGSMLPATSETLPIEQIGQRITLIDRVVKDFMQQGRDYDTIPGTNKPSLLKPGAEKLGLAFQLSPTFEVIDRLEQHEERFFFYRVRCTLTHRCTGVVIANQEGTCSSSERGRESAPANTILKMAEKRAYVGAILLATFSSDRFTQDMEDYAQEDGRPSAASKAKGAASPDGAAIFPIGKHKGTAVSEIPAGYLEWCAENMKDGSAKAMAIAELERRSKPKDASPKKETDLVSECERIEGLIFGDEDVSELRTSYMGSADFNGRSDKQVENYHKHLVALQKNEASSDDGELPFK